MRTVYRHALETMDTLLDVVVKKAISFTISGLVCLLLVSGNRYLPIVGNGNALCITTTSNAFVLR